MIKKDVIQRFKEKVQSLFDDYEFEVKVTYQLAEEILDMYDEVFYEWLQKKDTEDKFIFGSVGRFKIVVRKERAGFSPQTKEKITIPEKKVLKFTATKFQKEFLDSHIDRDEISE